MKTIGLRDSDTQARYRAQAGVLKALAHPTRLFMVEELSRQEHNVRELAELVGAEMSTVSKHLGQLKHAGIVRDDKRGSQVYYRLSTPCALRFFQCAEAILESRDGAWYQPA
jgi:DNA-binding transcriptional ArsR family regulator